MRGVDRYGKNRLIDFPANPEEFWDITESQMAAA